LKQYSSVEYDNCYNVLAVVELGAISNVEVTTPKSIKLVT